MQEKLLPCTNTPLYVQIAVPTPIRKLFDYLPPKDMQGILQPGIRVQIPFGKRNLIGIVVALTNTTEVPTATLKHIINVIDKQPIFPPKLYDLLIWASKYYQYPLGLVFDAALTKYLREGKVPNTQQTTVTDCKHSFNQPEFKLNTQQTLAINTIEKSLHTFQTFLLDGVTGSGKTEIYLQMLTKILMLGKQALILVPEISLTPQTLAQFQQRFKFPVTVYHSQIGNKARMQAWCQAQSGEARIIIGTRSAAFLPLKNPGLFIIDEEHDSSFKQQEGFRYSARDLLIKRAQLENCPIILGSATPALESLWNAQNKRYLHLKLPQRAGLATTPSIEILDIRHKKLKQGLSLQLLAEIEKHLKNNAQVLLFLNRRGYAPVLMCNNCNWIQNCNNCAARMIIHFYPKPAMLCHHCQTKIAMPASCPSCGDLNLAPIGFGTEKLEQTLKTIFPTANILRADSDVTAKKNAMQNIVEQVTSGAANILLGTQMLAKGHHFPNLSLVAILDIDGALFSGDFRTIEHMGQLLTQVAGRAGRAELPGHVMLQTQHPHHPLLQKLLLDGYHALCEQLLAERQAAKLPPFGYQILLQAASKKPLIALDFLHWLKKQNQLLMHKNIELLGPIPAPIEKKASFFRAQLLLQSNNRALLHNTCAALLNKIVAFPKLAQIRWSVDVDPLDFY